MRSPSCATTVTRSAAVLLVIPRRHVADFFEMTIEEQSAVLDLLRRAQLRVQEQFQPDGYNIGVNVGKAAGQSRMHVHLHLIPRYIADVPDPRGGIRCVLRKGVLSTRMA